MKKLIFLLILAHFLKELLWLGIIPLWHFPDEEQHFSLTSFYAEKGRFPKGSEFDVNKEIDLSSEILGTKRDKRGINEFTYHSEHKIPYTKSQIGLYEEEIKNLNNQEYRKEMVKREAGRYGPIYYFLTSIPYKIFFKEDLFVRVFASRFISVILSTLTVLIVYLIAKDIFNDFFYTLSLVFLVSFQPMFSFVSAGISSDNFFNLVFSLILYLCIKIFFSKKTISKKLCSLFPYKIINLSLLLFTLVLGFYTKKQVIIGFPVIFFALVIFILKRKDKIKKIHFFGFLLTTIFLTILAHKKIKIPDYDPKAPSELTESFFQYIFWHLKHTIAETIPWYWGVFNWLGVTLPRWVNKVQARILIISSVGLLVYFIKVLKQNQLSSRINQKIIFLTGSAFIYYFSIITWDYFFRKGHGFSFGIQGRYFFPTIVSHHLIILLGIISLAPLKLKTLITKALLIWWTILSYQGIKTATKAYYNLKPLSVFLNQLSQYKPTLFKAEGIIAIFFVFLTVFGTFFFYFLFGNIKTSVYYIKKHKTNFKKKD